MSDRAADDVTHQFLHIGVVALDRDAAVRLGRVGLDRSLDRSLPSRCKAKSAEKPLKLSFQ